MESQRVKDILPAVIGNIQSYNNTTDKKTKHAIRYGMRRLIQYATEAEPKIISQRALSICQSKGIDWTKLKKNVPSGIKGKPAVLGDHSEPLMELVWSIYRAEEAQIEQILIDYPPICWITREEDDTLNRNGFKNKRPGGWKKIYDQCGIVL